MSGRARPRPGERPHRGIDRLAAVAMLWASVATAGCSGEASGLDESSAPSAEQRGPPAADLRLTRVSLLQGVDVPLMRDGVEVAAGARNAPIVTRRPALLRAFVAPEAGFRPRELVARLELEHPLGTRILEDARSVTAASADADPESTFNFEIPAELVDEGLTYAVSLVEARPGVGTDGAGAGARWPARGTLPLAPSSTNGPLRLEIVPVVQDGVAPDLSAGRIRQYRDHFFSLFPVPEVQLSIHEPVTPPVAVEARGGGWAELLNFIERLRLSESADGRTYYYGAVAPAPSQEQYCEHGCVAGLATVPPDDSSFGRSAVGLGFFPDGSGSAFVASHELGHALGRPHAPCGARDADPDFPYPDASIGVWGIDLTSNELKSPHDLTDLLGYCEPRWVSDFTYRLLFERIARINAEERGVRSSGSEREGGAYRVVIVGEDGALRWGLPLDAPPGPLGPAVTIRTSDATGRGAGSLTGHFTPFADLGGGLVLIAERSFGPGAEALQPLDWQLLGSPSAQ